MIPDETVRRWQQGDTVDGVAFRLGTHVRILDGPFADECGSVRELIEVQPEPSYRVDVDAAHVQLRVDESALGAA